MYTIVDRIEPLQIMTLEEAKDQLNIVDFNDDDDYIMTLVATAGDMAERYTNKRYSQCNIQAELPEGDYCAYLPYTPIASITSVVNDGNDIDYKFNNFSNRISVTPSDINLSENTVITYVAGYTDVPDIVKHACKVIVADLYENRESQGDAKMTDVKFTALRLLN